MSTEYNLYMIIGIAWVTDKMISLVMAICIGDHQKWTTQIYYLLKWLKVLQHKNPFAKSQPFFLVAMDAWRHDVPK